MSRVSVSGDKTPGLCVRVVLCPFMSHEAHDRSQKRLKVMEERGKEPDKGGVTLSNLGFKC